jgi:hypothetical protein
MKFLFIYLNLFLTTFGLFANFNTQDNQILKNNCENSEGLSSNKNLNFTGWGRNSCNKCQLGRAGFSTMNSSNWYTIDTISYPVTVPLSINRNAGFTQGDVELTPTGLIINKSGNYFVSFSAILTNPGPDAILIPVFVIQNGIFEPNSMNNIGSAVSLPQNFILPTQASGIIENVNAGTTISIVATNGGSDQPQPVTVIAWNIDLFRIPCTPQ